MTHDYINTILITMLSLSYLVLLQMVERRIATIRQRLHDTEMELLNLKMEVKYGRQTKEIRLQCSGHSDNQSTN